jgi:hypothetical protein
MTADQQEATGMFADLRVGAQEFDRAIECLEGQVRPSVIQTLRISKALRDGFVTELQVLASSHGWPDLDPEEGPGPTAPGWNRSAHPVTESDPASVMAACARSSAESVDCCEVALLDDISGELRDLVQRRLLALKDERQRIASACASSSGRPLADKLRFAENR